MRKTDNQQNDSSSKAVKIESFGLGSSKKKVLIALSVIPSLVCVLYSFGIVDGLITLIPSADGLKFFLGILGAFIGLGSMILINIFIPTVKEQN